MCRRDPETDTEETPRAGSRGIGKPSAKGMAGNMPDNPDLPNGEKHEAGKPRLQPLEKVHCLQCGSTNVKVSFCLKNGKISAFYQCRICHCSEQFA